MEQAISISSQIFSISILRYFLIAGIPFLLFYKFFGTKLKNLKIQHKSASSKDFIREILHSVQSTAIMAVIAYLVIYTPFRNYTLIYTNIEAYSWWWIPLSAVIGLVIHDTYFYWMHRLLHHPKLFRHTHLLHHKSTNPSPWTSYSFHFIEGVAETGILVVLVFILPLHPLAIALFTISGFIINVYGHLGYEIAPKWFRHSPLFELLNTSVHHNIHHSKFKGNYGLYFRFWDRLMNTEHPDYVKSYDEIQERRFGTESHQAREELTP